MPAIRLVATDLDVRFQTALANDFPSFLTNPTRPLERSGAVEDRLADLRGRARFAESSGRDQRRAGLPVLGRAPDFTGNQRWFNTAGGSATLNFSGGPTLNWSGPTVANGTMSVNATMVGGTTSIMTMASGGATGTGNEGGKGATGIGGTYTGGGTDL